MQEQSQSTSGPISTPTSTETKPYKNSTVSKTQQLNSKDWIDSECLDFKSVELEGNKIIATGLKGALVFSRNLQNSFTIQIGNFTNGIALGIVDSQYKSRDNLIYLPNRLVYGNDGRCWDGILGKKDQGRGFKTGEKIEVTISRQNAKVEWVAHDGIRHSVQSQMIGNSGDKGVRWVGYVCLWGKGDWVRILQHK